MVSKRNRPALVPWLSLARVEPGSYLWIFTRDRTALISLGVVAVVVVGAVFAPLLTPYSDQGLGVPHTVDAFQPPSVLHPFGTDDLGRDGLARVLFGARTSLTIGFV